jgi:LysR family hydrogen peroxide-inducible transcriptional activator
MTLAQLTYLVALDTHRHFRKAASHCRVSQPSLSVQIRKLEEELDVVLFDRDKKPLVPTSVGEQVIARARMVLAEAEGIRDLVESGTGELAGTLRVGILPTLAPYLLPRILACFPEQYPHLRLVFEEVRHDPMMALIKREVLDAGLVTTPTASRGLIDEVLFEEPLVGYVSAGHRLAQQPALAPSDLAFDDMWLLTPGSSLREQVVGLCDAPFTTAQHPWPETTRIETTSLETIKRLVEQGRGMVVIPWLAATESGRLDAQLVKPFAAPVPTRSVRLVYPRALLKKPLTSALAGVISETVPSLLPASPLPLVTR